MTEKKVIDVLLRPKRQVTLPREICEQLRVGPGDRLELVVEAGQEPASKTSSHDLSSRQDQPLGPGQSPGPVPMNRTSRQDPSPPPEQRPGPAFAPELARCSA